MPEARRSDTGTADDWVVLHATDSAYGVAAGDVLPLSETLCARMLTGHGPRVAPRVAEVSAYRTAPVMQEHVIGTYVGIPLTGPDGELFGALCALDPGPSPASLESARPLFELQARLLSGLIAIELTAARVTRKADAVGQQAGRRLLDGDAWLALLTAEQLRCAPHATPASLVAVEISGPHPHPRLAEDLAARAQRLLADRRRAPDVLADLGHGMYGVLCPETPEALAQTIATELVVGLQEIGVGASCGVAGLDPRDGDLTAAWHRAQVELQADRLCPAAALAAH